MLRSFGCAVALSILLLGAPVRAETFKFIALGDMPYGKAKWVEPAYTALIEEINRRKPDFSIHVGDIKSGGKPCSDEVFKAQHDRLMSFAGPLVYTPGDNEWTDCHRSKAGGYNPLERLKVLRAMFFGEAQSLGKSPVKLERQVEAMPARMAASSTKDGPARAGAAAAMGKVALPENARFAHKGIHIVTAHVVGSNNNFEVRDLTAAKEFFERDEANIAWLRYAFKKAITQDAKAVVLAIHADMFEFGFNSFRKERFIRHSGYLKFATELIDQANRFKKPVLLIFGDSHIFRVFRPFPKRARNIMALEVFGERNMHAVEVSVDTDDASVFGFRPVFNPMK